MLCCNFTLSPALYSWKVGMLWMPHCCEISRDSSTFTYSTIAALCRLGRQRVACDIIVLLECVLHAQYNAAKSVAASCSVFSLHAALLARKCVTCCKVHLCHMSCCNVAWCTACRSPRRANVPLNTTTHPQQSAYHAVCTHSNGTSRMHTRTCTHMRTVSRTHTHTCAQAQFT